MSNVPIRDPPQIFGDQHLGVSGAAPGLSLCVQLYLEVVVPLVVPVDHTQHVDAEVLGPYKPASSCVRQQPIVPLADYVCDIILEPVPISYVRIFIVLEFRPPLVAFVGVIALEWFFPADGPLCRCFDVVLTLACFDHAAVVPVLIRVDVAPVVIVTMQVTAVVSAAWNALVSDVRHRGAVVPSITCVTVIVVFLFVVFTVVSAYLPVLRGPVRHKLGFEEAAVAPAAVFQVAPVVLFTVLGTFVLFAFLAGFIHVVHVSSWRTVVPAFPRVASVVILFAFSTLVVARCIVVGSNIICVIPHKSIIAPASPFSRYGTCFTPVVIFPSQLGALVLTFRAGDVLLAL